MIKYSPEYDIVIPVTGDGKYEPLFALYTKSAAPHIELMLSKGQRKIIKVLEQVKVKYVEFNSGDQILNLNTNDDYMKLK